MTMLREPPWSADLDWPEGMSPFEPFDHAIQIDPYAHYRWLRENAPVVRAGDPAAPLYIVSSFDSVTQGLRDADQFRSLPPQTHPLAGFVLLLDAPDHVRLRKTVSRAFSPRAVTTLEPQVREVVRRRWADFLGQGGGEALGEFASPTTIEVISSVLGVPVEKSEQMRQWTREMSIYLGVALRGVPGNVDDSGFRNFSDYMGRVLDAALEAPGEDVAGSFARLRAAGDITSEEAIGFLTLLFVAGNETTTLVIGNCLQYLCDHPEWLDYLRQPDGPDLFLNEILRFLPPFHRLTRYTYRDAALGGYRIPAGSSIRFLVGAANRDESAFENGEAFDPARANAHQATFGYGPHMCMGSWLAKLEVRAILQEIANTVGRIERDPDTPTVPVTGGAFGTVGLTAFGVRLFPR